MSASTPAEPEAFPSLADIKRALSPDCFRAEASTSLLYVARSVALVLLLGWALSEARERLQSGPLLVLVTLAYVYLQGLVLWGVVRSVFLFPFLWLSRCFTLAQFTIGHDCGHGAFSSNGNASTQARSDRLPRLTRGFFPPARSRSELGGGELAAFGHSSALRGVAHEPSFAPQEHRQHGSRRDFLPRLVGA